MLELGLKVTLAYIAGSVMGALLIGWFRGGVDIRELGSGNAGGTNALRTQGRLFALGVMIIDVGKGIAAVALLPPLDIPGIGFDPDVDRALLRYAIGFAAIAGHVFPLWHEFRGGKGGATAAGLLCWFAPSLAVPILGLWLLIVFFTGFVGLATIAAAIGAAVWAGVAWLPERMPFFVFSSAIAVLIVYTHRGNIVRMRQGTESRFGRFFGLR